LLRILRPLPDNCREQGFFSGQSSSPGWAARGVLVFKARNSATAQAPFNSSLQHHVLAERQGNTTK